MEHIHNGEKKSNLEELMKNRSTLKVKFMPYNWDLNS